MLGWGFKAPCKFAYAIWPYLWPIRSASLATKMHMAVVTWQTNDAPGHAASCLAFIPNYSLISMKFKPCLHVTSFLLNCRSLKGHQTPNCSDNFWCWGKRISGKVVHQGIVTHAWNSPFHMKSTWGDPSCQCHRLKSELGCTPEIRWTIECHSGGKQIMKREAIVSLN